MTRPGPRFLSGFFRVFGFEADTPDAWQCLAPACALALALAFLPCLLLLPLDADRAVPLAFLPAVWLGWKISRPSSVLDTALFAWAVLAMLVSAAFSDHSARAFATTAAVGWTFGGALVARNLAPCVPAVRLVLAGMLAGAAAGTVMLGLGVDAPTATFPIYGSVRLFGAHQFAGCVAALGLLAHTRGRPWRITTGVFGLIAGSGLMWSGSRAPVVALAVMAAAWFWRGSRTEKKLVLFWLPAFAVVALTVSSLLGRPYEGMGWSSAVARTVQSAGIEQVSSERSHFWSETLDHALKSPWIGYGADGYRFMQPAQNGSQPHNMLLQWLLEYGIVGLVPLGWLLARGVRGLFTRSPSDETHSPFPCWASASLLGAATYGLLDGVFYHATIFMPVAVIAGFALGATPAGGTQAFTPARAHPVLRPLLLAALVVLLLHNWLGLVLLKARNITPDSVPARALRVFPSTTHGLQKWTESWRRTDPQAELEWVKWAQSVSVEAASYHVYAAQLHIWRKDYKSAEAELMDCLRKVHRVERRDVQNALDTVRALDAAKPTTQSPPQP
jgi:O-antigen ligase